MLRLIECVQGSVEIKLECEPAFDYGGLAADWSYGGSGYNEALARSEGMDLELRLATDLRLGFEGPRARARTTLHEGDVAFVALGWSKHPLPVSYEEAEAWLARTGRFWQEWLKHGTFPDHPWRSHLQRSALTLKGLTYTPSGAMIAAATTSLPETPGGDRNWDYRYSWIRDSTFMLWALYTLGFDEEANDFFYFVADVVEAEEGELQIMYGIGGEKQAPGAGARPPLRLRPRATGADRQRRLQPAPARRLGRRARLDLPAHPLARSASGPPVADHQAPGRRGARALARARPRDLGGARRAPALHLLEADVLGGGRPRRAARTDPGRRRDGERAGRRPPTRSTPTSARTGSTSAACSSSTTRPRRSTHRCC